jgi:hypothetical protein
MSAPPWQCSNPGVRTIEEELRVAFHKAGLVSDDNAENLNKVWCTHGHCCAWAVLEPCALMGQWSSVVHVIAKAHSEPTCGQLDGPFDNDGKVKYVEPGYPPRCAKRTIPTRRTAAAGGPGLSR